MAESVKTCSTCHESKPLNAFHRNDDAPDGRKSRCKECRAVYSARYYAKNAEKVRARSAAYRAAHRAKARAYSAIYYAENRETMQERRRQRWADREVA